MVAMKHKSERKNESNGHPNDALRLLYFRRCSKMTQPEAAKYLSIPLSSYRAYESGALPVTLKLRRTIGMLAPIEILPMDPDQDPKLVISVLRNTQIEERTDEVKNDEHVSASSVGPSKQRSILNNAPKYGFFGARLYRSMRENKIFRQEQLRQYPALRRLYCEWRDATYIASAFLTLFWISCLQLNISFGAFTDAANLIGGGSLILNFMLIPAVFQDTLLTSRRLK